MKKVVSRKIEKDSYLTIHEAKEIERKTPPKKIFKEDREKYLKKTEIAEISVMETAQDVEQEKTIMEESLPALAIVESPVKEISKRKRRKKLRKKRPMLVAFKLPRPCKIGVCKPKICCHKTTFGKLRIRYRAYILEMLNIEENFCRVLKFQYANRDLYIYTKYLNSS